MVHHGYSVPMSIQADIHVPNSVKVTERVGGNTGSPFDEEGRNVHNSAMEEQEEQRIAPEAPAAYNPEEMEWKAASDRLAKIKARLSKPPPVPEHPPAVAYARAPAPVTYAPAAPVPAPAPAAPAPVVYAPAAPAPAPAAYAPITYAPAPVAPAPVARAPVAPAPVAPAPVARAPVAPAPVAPAPVVRAPVAPAPVARAPVPPAPQIVMPNHVVLGNHQQDWGQQQGWHQEVNAVPPGLQIQKPIRKYSPAHLRVSVGDDNSIATTPAFPDHLYARIQPSAPRAKKQVRSKQGKTDEKDLIVRFFEGIGIDEMCGLEFDDDAADAIVEEQQKKQEIMNQLINKSTQPLSPMSVGGVSQFTGSRAPSVAPPGNFYRQSAFPDPFANM